MIVRTNDWHSRHSRVWTAASASTLSIRRLHNGQSGFPFSVGIELLSTHYESRRDYDLASPLSAVCIIATLKLCESLTMTDQGTSKRPVFSGHFQVQVRRLSGSIIAQGKTLTSGSLNRRRQDDAHLELLFCAFNIAI